MSGNPRCKKEFNSSKQNNEYDFCWKWYCDNDENLIFPIINDHTLFQNRLINLFNTEDKKNIFLNKLIEDKFFFKEVNNTFNSLRKHIPFQLEINNPKTKQCIENLEKNGIHKYEGLFTDSDLKDLINFQETITTTLGKKIEHSGYISLGINNNQIYHLSNNIVKPNNGMVRLQSKGMGFFHPGSERLLNDYELNLIFKYWYKNLNSKFHRLTMDWVYPAEYSHNGWHCDVVRDQLKVMILLDDVTQDNAPMYYALGSHNVKTDIELKIKHAILKYGTNHLQSLGKQWKKHPAALNQRHVGYISDEIADNVPDEINDLPVTLENDEYQKLVCTGKKGDCVIFESSGFHSGNRAFSGVRKDIVFTMPDNLSFKNQLLGFLEKNHC
jgi:hypothetical protein